MIPRGMRFRVELLDATARGYVCENFGALLRLPDLGPIGSNGLANARDFLTPVAAFEDIEGEFELVAKFQGQLWRARDRSSPLDVVAWHGNYAPYKYDLRRFNTIGSISYDHPDPSIFTVLTFAQRHARHRQHGFRDFPAALAGGGKHLPAAVVPPQRRQRIHGPDPLVSTMPRPVVSCPAGRQLAQLHERPRPGRGQIREGQRPRIPPNPMHIIDTMAFMFETRAVIRPTAQALESPQLQRDYADCWRGLKNNFRATRA